MVILEAKLIDPATSPVETGLLVLSYLDLAKASLPNPVVKLNDPLITLVLSFISSLN
jgi:hypothetical protein